MSRTRRKDPLDITPPFKAFIAPIVGLIEDDRSPKIVAKAHRDKKKGHKPGRAAKISLHKGQKTKPKHALRTARDYDDLPSPKQPHTDVWLYA